MLPHGFSYACDEQPRYQRALIRCIERCTGQKKLWRLYQEYLQEQQTHTESFWDASLKKLNLHLVYDTNQRAKIPKNGPLVVVANHPYGVLDGVIITQLIHTIRADSKVLTNAALCKLPDTEDVLLPINFNGTPDARVTNLNTRKAAKEQLMKGGCVVVFPAGGVSTIPSWRHKRAMDGPWQPFIARLIIENDATVVPLFFEGQNSMLFQYVSQISTTLRLSLYFKEVADKIGSEVRLHIGDPIKYSELAHISKRQALSDHLRALTYKLAEDSKR